MADSSFADQSFHFPGPPFHVDLPLVDALHPIHYSRRLLIFRCDSATQRDAQLQALKIGLQAVVRRCPILGGIIAPLPSDESVSGKNVDPNWRTILPSDGLELVVKDLQMAMPSLDDLEAAEFPVDQLPYKLLVPVPQDISNDRPYAACKIQFSSIKGGSILTWTMSHSVGDGGGSNELIRILSEEVRLAQTQPAGNRLGENSETHDTMGLDRSAMSNMKSEDPFKIEDHPGYSWNDKIYSSLAPMPGQTQSRHPFEATSPELPQLFYISPTSMARLKADATRQDAPPISTHDALCALIWRSLMIIRSRRNSSSSLIVPESTATNLFMPSDARRHLNLPHPYIGNAIYQLNTALTLDAILSPSNGLQQAASAVRRAITAVNPRLVASLLSETNERWIPWAFLGTFSTTGVAMGTDWTSSVLYDYDWGTAFGPMIRYRYPDDRGTNCIMPKRPDGAAEVIVSVMADEVQMLRSVECFGRYLS